MDAEITDRILECLRKLDVGESISADGIADEIGQKLSDVYDALEDLENAKLVQMHVAATKGRDPTYTLTPKGKRALQPEVQDVPEPEKAEVPNVKGKKAAGYGNEALVKCPDCGKMVKRISTHKKMGGCKPKADPDPVPAPAEYAEAESNATATIEHEIPEVLEQQAAEDPCMDDEVPLFDERTERIIQRVQDAIDRTTPAEALVLKASPGMMALLRLLFECQRAVEDGADVHMSASIAIAPGLDVSVHLDAPARKEGSDE